MGQRLVVDIIQKDKVVAAIYYHWSAYFCSTIYELAKLSEAILKAQKEGKDKLLAVIECLEEEEEYTEYNGNKRMRCGGVRGRPEEYEAAKRLYPNHIFKTEEVDRNCGLISFTEEGIDSFHSWSEGDASINLDTLEIENSVTLDPDPFEFKDAEAVNEDEDGCDYCYYSGKIKINGRTSPVDAFDCNCESILELFDFMDKKYKIYKDKMKEKGIPYDY